MSNSEPRQFADQDLPFADAWDQPIPIEPDSGLVALGWVGLILSLLGIASVVVFFLPAVMDIQTVSNAPAYSEIAHNPIAFQKHVFATLIGLAMGILLLYAAFHAINGSRKCRIPLNIYAICTLFLQIAFIVFFFYTIGPDHHPTSIVPCIGSVVAIVYSVFALFIVNNCEYVSDYRGQSKPLLRKAIGVNPEARNDSAVEDSPDL